MGGAQFREEESDDEVGAGSTNAVKGPARAGPKTGVRRWSVPPAFRGLFSRRWVSVVISIFAVSILALSSSLPVYLPVSSHRTSTEAGDAGAGNTSVEFPYLVNTSQFPRPDTLSEAGSNLSLPQLAVASFGEGADSLLGAPSGGLPLAGSVLSAVAQNSSDSIPLYELAYVDENATGSNSVDFRIGTVDPATAYGVMTNTSCGATCLTNLPILWGAPIALASFGASAIQTDAIASSGSLVAVAAAVGGETHVYYSDYYGTNGSWSELTSTGLVEGGSPRLQIDSCDVFLTTLTPTNTLVTNLPLGCLLLPPPGTQTAVTVANQYLGGFHPNLPSPPPSVTSVSPSEGYGGTVVTVDGSGFGAGAEVSFGTVPSTSVSVSSSNELIAVAPPNAAPSPVDVTITVGGIPSAPNPPADQFTYSLNGQAPTVSSLVPNSGSSGTGVTVYGSGFQRGGTPTVYFGSAAGSSVTVISDDELTVNAPSGQSAVDVQVSVGGQISATNYPADVFTYVGGGGAPTVTGVLPNQGTGWSEVMLTGTGFEMGTTASFGGYLSPSVVVLSSTVLMAESPLGPANGAVAIQVTNPLGTSLPNPPYDQFTYVSPNAPTVSGILPASGPVGSEVTVSGASFFPGSTVDFGGYASPSVRVLANGTLTALAPDGAGTVDVTVTYNGLTSPTSPADHFSYTGTPSSVSLPLSAGNAPMLLKGGSTGTEEAIFESVPSNDSIQWLESTNEFGTHTTVWIGAYNASYGSPVFTRVGETSLQVFGGAPGAVSVASEGPYVFGVFTTRSQGETVLDTVVSTDGGSHWEAASQVTADLGSVDSPEVVASPAGYIYATWRDDGAGPWEADQAVFSDTGRILVPAQAIPDSGGRNASSASWPSVVVDHFQRPLFIWATTNATGAAVLNLTGAFLSARQIVDVAWEALNNSLPSDYVNFASRGTYNFRQELSAEFGSVQHDLAVGDWSALQTATLGTLYANLSVSRPGLTSVGAPGPNCSASLGTGATAFSNGSGPYQAGTFMGVYLAWLIQAEGCGSIGKPPWLGTPENGGLVLTGGNAIPVPFGTSGSASASGDSIKVSPIARDPNLVLLNASGNFPGKFSPAHFTVDGCTLDEELSYGPSEYETTVVFGTSEYTYWSAWAVPSVFVTNVASQTSGTWSEHVTVSFTQILREYDSCTEETTNFSETPSMGPAQVSLSVSGNYTTWLGYDALPPRAVVTSGSGGNENLAINWTNSMVAAVHELSVQGPSYDQSDSTSVGAIPEEFDFTSLPNSPGGQEDYSVGYSINSTAGSSAPSGATVLNTAEVSTLARPLWSNYSCSFAVINDPIEISLRAGNVSNVSGTDVTLTWYSNTPGTGWAEYSDSGGGTFEAIALRFGPQSGSYEYVDELHGLDPWGQYAATVGVTSTIADTGCVEYQNTTTLEFLTTGIAPLSEQDLPYDSVTQQGGGAVVDWSIPVAFNSTASFVNGSFAYWPSNGSESGSSTVVIPFETLNRVGWSWVGATSAAEYGLNLTTLNLNWTYDSSLVLNFTYRGSPYVAVGGPDPMRFTYAKDTSGDGLTDWEKVRGWEVTTEGASGTWSNEWVSANPQAYATNGLVSDYIEKEFGLNPTTVDTAGSHILDTWNLTFEVGSYSACQSSEFRCWYENGSNPFSAPQYPNGPAPGHAWTNYTPLNRYPLDDGTPSDAYYLWSSGALTYLEGLVTAEGVGWLRAVTGYDSAQGTDTLTVEGKLSWGANPLARSTSVDGTPDGDQVDPLGVTYLNVTVTSWNLTGVPDGAGVAAFITANSGSSVDYAGYTQEVYAGSYGGAGRSLYGGNQAEIYNFPVASTQQYAALNVSLVKNVSSSISNAANLGPISVDLLNDQSHTDCTSCGGSSPSLSISYRALTLFAKTTTYVVVPGDNSTLSNLPMGLQRYTGEQNFVLLEVNSSAGTSVTLPYPNATAGDNIGGGYSVSLAAGINNLIVPRGLFNNSPLEQALLNDSSVSIQDRSFNVALQGEWDPALWENRMTDLTDYPRGSPGHIVLYSNNSSMSCVRSDPCGGIPSDPAAEADASALAIQGIFILNLTGQSGLQEDLENLLAGLVLNSSGNFTGWLDGVTGQLSSLGFSATVMSALANSFEYNAGAYGVPASHQKPAESWVEALSGTIWNAISGVVGSLSVFWNAVTASLSFMADIVATVASWALEFISPALGALRQVGAAIEAGINELATLILNAVTYALTRAFTPVWDVIELAVTSIENLEVAAEKATLEYLNGQGSLPSAVAAEGIALTPFFGLALAVVVAIDVAIGITMPVSIGIGTVLGILVTVILSVVGTGSLLSLGGQYLGPIRSDFNSLFTGISSTFVTAAEKVLNYTLSTVFQSGLSAGSIQPLPDPPDFIGTSALIGSGTSLGLGAVKALKTPSDAAAQAGFFISLVSFGLALHVWAFEAIQPNGCNDLPNILVDSLLGEDIAAFLLGLGGLGLDIKGFGSDFSSNKILAVGGLGLDGYGIYTGVNGINTDIGCESTATG